MKTPKSFEEGIARLESLLEKMSDDNTPLAETVKLYAEAAALIDYCSTALDTATLQIREIDAKLAACAPAEEEV